MKFAVETAREDDGRFIAEIPDLPGALAYGETRGEAIANVEALALRVFAERAGYQESIPRTALSSSVVSPRTNEARRKPDASLMRCTE